MNCAMPGSPPPRAWCLIGPCKRYHRHPGPTSMQATGRIAVPSGYLLKDVTPTQAELAHGLGCISLRGTPHCSLSGHPLPLLSPLLPLHAACALPTRRWMATLKSGRAARSSSTRRAASLSSSCRWSSTPRLAKGMHEAVPSTAERARAERMHMCKGRVQGRACVICSRARHIYCTLSCIASVDKVYRIGDVTENRRVLVVVN